MKRKKSLYNRYELPASSLRSPGKLNDELSGRSITILGRFSMKNTLRVTFRTPRLHMPIFRHSIIYSKEHSIPNSQSHASDLPCFFITICWLNRITKSRHKFFRVEKYFRTPGHMSGVRNDFVRNVRHPSSYMQYFSPLENFERI
jgi:hypothetical protein